MSQPKDVAGEAPDRMGYQSTDQTLELLDVLEKLNLEVAGSDCLNQRTQNAKVKKYLQILESGGHLSC